MFTTFPGLETPALVPTHHTFVGLLSGLNNESKITEDLAKFIDGWKEKGKKKFMYISFGSINILDEYTMNSLIEIIEETGIPTIWSLKS
jgi:hypothetical protein